MHFYFVLKDPGQVRVAFDIHYNGTPRDPSDDIEVPDCLRHGSATKPVLCCRRSWSVRRSPPAGT